MEQKLKPCPFCGGEASMEDQGDQGYSVRCLECEQPYQQAFRKTAEIAWNTRASDELIEELVSGIGSAYRTLEAHNLDRNTRDKLQDAVARAREAGYGGS